MSVPLPPTSRMMKQYEIVSSSRRDDFNKTLQNYYADGWYPDGELIISTPHVVSHQSANMYYTQKMVKETKL